MPEVPGYVLDATIAVKWLIKSDDEPYREQADLVDEDWREGRINLVGPTVLNYEVGHALTRAVRRERVSPAQGRELYRRFLSWQIPTIHGDDLMTSAWELASTSRTSFYDSSYLALGLRLSMPVLHADDKLRQLTRDRIGAPALWIEDYPPEPR